MRPGAPRRSHPATNRWTLARRLVVTKPFSRARCRPVGNSEHDRQRDVSARACGRDRKASRCYLTLERVPRGCEASGGDGEGRGHADRARSRRPAPGKAPLGVDGDEQGPGKPPALRLPRRCQTNSVRRHDRGDTEIPAAVFVHAARADEHDAARGWASSAAAVPAAAPRALADRLGQTGGRHPSAGHREQRLQPGEPGACAATTKTSVVRTRDM